MSEFWEPLWQVVVNLALVLRFLGEWALHWALVLAWFAWWLWGVNWHRTWPVLGRGAWVAVVLGVLSAALVWSQVAPGECTCLGFVAVPNFWWQLGGVSLLAALTLFCGWLQGVFGWAPPEVSLEPPDGPAMNGGHGDHTHH